jgi:hypothetical protein
MAQPRIVFEPYASGVQRDVVEEIVNHRSIAFTGYDQWYPGAFFAKIEAGEFWATCWLRSGPSDVRILR